MPKDYKIGMLVGLVLVIGAGLTLSLHPSLTIKASIAGPGNAGAEPGHIEQPGITPSPANSLPITAETKGEQKEVKIIEGPKYHTVRNGETLSGISYQYYGTENKWQKILDANKDAIKDVKNLKPGTRLVIPE